MMRKLDGGEANPLIARICYDKAIGYATELHGAIELRENEISLKDGLAVQRAHLGLMYAQLVSHVGCSAPGADDRIDYRILEHSRMLVQHAMLRTCTRTHTHIDCTRTHCTRTHWRKQCGHTHKCQYCKA